jgi:hypothetical protein
VILAPGIRLGVYEVTAQIGEGGVGRDGAGPDRRARLQREAEVLASLHHHIVDVDPMVAFAEPVR